jgi:cyclic-di-AMP phosphodiesterase PgpH
MSVTRTGKNTMPETAKTSNKIKHPTGVFRKTAERILPGWIHRFEEPKWRRWIVIVVTSLVAAFLMAPNCVPVYVLTVGEPATETIVAPKTFRVFDDAATQNNRDQALKSVWPVYDFDDEMVYDVQAKISAAFKFMRDYLAEEATNSAEPQAEPHKETASGDSELPLAAPSSAASKSFRPLDDGTLRTRFENLLGTTVAPSSFYTFKLGGFNSLIERDLRSPVVHLLEKGVVVSRDLVMRDGKKGILLRPKSKDKREFVKDPSTIVDLKEADDFLKRSANLNEEASARDPALLNAIRRVARDMINVNITFNREKTTEQKATALVSVKSVYFQVLKGEPLVRQGEPVTAEHQRKLMGLSKAYPPYSRYLIFAGYALILMLLLRLCFYFCEQHLDRSRHASNDLLLVCILLLGTVVLARFLSSFAPLIPSAGRGMDSRSIFFAAPVAIGSMLTALMVDARIAFVFSALAALVAALSVEGDIYLFAFYFVAGIVGLHGMSRIADRTAVLRAGLVVGLVNMVSILAIKMALGQLSHVQDLYETGLGFLGGVLAGLLVSGLAPLLEPLGYTTNIRLLEIANLNHPLLKELSLSAPGTYHHAIMVGNLAEAAAESIGANPLLAKVGAYYHDIGKVGTKTKPGYFIENQGRGLNPHDKLEPSMSALILVSHVKYGVEKAKEYRLGSPIIDIIQQHHGSNLIKFFYNKALEKGEKTHQTVVEDKYRYPGPRPQSKEAALVMLADVVEAACRTLSDPTPARIQKRVQELILGLFNEGQLDQSTLTLKDLHNITKSFVRALQGILHARIDYPSVASIQERANGDLHRLPADKDRHRPGRPAEESGKNIRRLGL